MARVRVKRGNLQKEISCPSRFAHHVRQLLRQARTAAQLRRQWMAARAWLCGQLRANQHQQQRRAAAEVRWHTFPQRRNDVAGLRVVVGGMGFFSSSRIVVRHTGVGLVVQQRTGP